MVRCLRPHLLILQCVTKKKPPPKAGAPKHLSGVWPCFHLARHFLTNQPSLLNEHCDRGKKTAHRLSSDGCKDPTQILEEHLSSLDSSQALIRPRILVGDPMEIHIQHAQSLGELVLDGSHKPFRALACPLDQAGLRAE